MRDRKIGAYILLTTYGLSALIALIGGVWAAHG